MSQILKDVYQEKYGKINFQTEPLSMANLRELAGICGELGLSVTERHLHSVIKGHQKPKDGLERVLQIHANLLDGQSELQARLHKKTFWTTNGIPDKAIIHGQAFICAFSGCDVIMLKTHPAMRYCLLHGKRRKRSEEQS